MGRKRRVPVDDMLHCSRCDTVKSTACFSGRALADGSIGWASQCRMCRSVMNHDDNERRKRDRYADYPDSALRRMLRELWPYRPGPEVKTDVR